MSASYKEKRFHRVLEDIPRHHSNQLEIDSKQKLLLAQKIFEHLSSYISELEAVVSRVITVYCSRDFTERRELKLIFEKIHEELNSFQKHFNISNTRDQYRTPIDRLENQRFLNSSSDESLSESGDNSMKVIKDEVKELINESKEAMGKLKIENETIHSLMNKNHQRKGFKANETSYSYDKTKERELFNLTETSTISPKQTSIDEERTSLRLREYKERLSKYSDYENVIDDLNRKKDENLQKLTSIEQRLTNIKKKIPEDDSGALKTSDLSNEEDDRFIDRKYKFERETRTSDTLNRDLNKPRNKMENDIESYRKYLRRIDEIREANKMKERKGYKDTTESRREERRQDRNMTEPDQKYKRDKSSHRSQALESEIDQLNKEITMIKGLIDSAMIQKKYQSK